MSSKIPVAISFSGVANFLGIIGIIGSLIFVGLELNQSQRIALANQQIQRLQASMDAINVHTQSGLVYRRWDEESKYAGLNFLTTAALQIEQDYYMYYFGLRSEDWWNERLQLIRGGQLNMCEMESVVEIAVLPPVIADAILEGLTEDCIPLLERFGYPEDGLKVDREFMNLDIDLRD
jgi:hypothetical protein